jgi:4-hydroxybenzoate polyprenyltransferase
MDKYLIMVLMFLIAGMGIAVTRDPPVIVMFYTMLGGAVLVIIYSAMKDRKARRDLNKSRKSKK